MKRRDAPQGLITQFNVVFTIFIFSFCEVKDKVRGAVISSVVHDLYWIHFVATALGFLHLSLAQSKVRL